MDNCEHEPFDAYTEHSHAEPCKIPSSKANLRGLNSWAAAFSWTTCRGACLTTCRCASEQGGASCAPGARQKVSPPHVQLWQAASYAQYTCGDFPVAGAYSLSAQLPALLLLASWWQRAAVHLRCSQPTLRRVAGILSSEAAFCTLSSSFPCFSCCRSGTQIRVSTMVCTTPPAFRTRVVKRTAHNSN